MIDVVLVFTIGLILALFAGGGWACLLPCASTSWTSWAFWTFVTGIAVASLAWCWTFGIGGGFPAATTLGGAASILGWGVAWRTGALRRLRRSLPIGLEPVDIIALLIVAVIMIAPGLNGHGSTTLVYRVGPDGVGNAVAAEALASGNNMGGLEREIIEATGASTIDSALDQNSHMLYSSASLRTQVRAEFLIAGLRWGYSGAAAIPLKMLGRERVWAVVTLLPALAALFAVLGIICILARAGVGQWKRATAAVLAIIGVTLLNAFREGGMAQMWVVPCVVAFGWAVLDESMSRKTRIWVGAIASAGLLPAYSDASLFLAALLALLILLTLLLRDRLRTLELCWFAAGAAAGLVATGPYLLRFVAYVPKRLRDSHAGGWMQPRWTTPSETIGLFNSYNLESHDGRFVLNNVPRSELLQLALAFSDLVLVGLTTYAVWLTVRSRASSLLVATVGMVAVFCIKARAIDQVTNYQYFKAAGIAQPLLALSLVLVWHSAASVARPTVRAALHGITAYAATACTVASVMYTFAFINQGSEVDRDLLNAIQRPKFLELINSRNVVGPSDSSAFLGIATLIPSSDLHWFGRSWFDVAQRLDGRESNPLSLLITKKDCKEWHCLAGVNPEAIHELGLTLRMVDLAPNSNALRVRGGASGPLLSTTISSMSQSVGGPRIGADFRPAS